MEKIKRVPRKIKKELKKIILALIDPSKELNLQSFSSDKRFIHLTRSYKGISVVCYHLR